MSRPGPKPKSFTTTWSPEFAYAIGLFTADGCLSKDGRHLDFTSKDRAQVEIFKRSLRLSTKTARKCSGAGAIAYHTQFGSTIFYSFLKSIGLTQAKSKTLQSVAIEALL